MSNEEQSALIQESDDRYNTHTLGIALQLSYANGTSSNYTANRLLTKVLDVCSPIFDRENSNINLELYSSDTIFVAMDEEFVFWTNSDSLLPSGYTTEQAYSDYLEFRRQQAVGEVLSLTVQSCTCMSFDMTFCQLATCIRAQLWKSTNSLMGT